MVSCDCGGREIGDVASANDFAATKTRIVLAGSRVHILGAFENIGMARERWVGLLSPNTSPWAFLTLLQHCLVGPRCPAWQGLQQPEDNRVEDEGEVLDGWECGKSALRGIGNGLGVQESILRLMCHETRINQHTQVSGSKRRQSVQCWWINLRAPLPREAPPGITRLNIQASFLFADESS